jgi:hypothetical protein
MKKTIKGDKFMIDFKELPEPDCHFYDKEYNKWIWAYSKELIDSITKKEPHPKNCTCGEESTGWMELKCCNNCGKPIKF